MTQAFRMEEDKMLDVVEKLIGGGDVGGKIDLIDNVSPILLSVRASDKSSPVVNAFSPADFGDGYTRSEGRDV